MGTPNEPEISYKKRTPILVGVLYFDLASRQARKQISENFKFEECNARPYTRILTDSRYQPNMIAPGVLV